MRVSDDALQRHIQILRDMGSPESQGVLPASLQMRLEVALDLYEARQHIAEIEQALTSSQTTSRHYYAKLTANNEAASKRIAELEAQLAEARRDGERLKEVRDLVFSYSDNEITDHPWWAVVRKNGMGSSAICAGPFFSRERAEECCEARRYEWGKGAFVFGFSGFRSEHYKTLRDLLDPDKKLRIKTAAAAAEGKKG